MNTFSRAFKYISRKYVRSILLLIILILMFTFLLVGVSIHRSASMEEDQLKASLGSSFALKILIDFNNESLWTDATNADGSPGKSYHSPIDLTDELAKRIMTVEGINAYNAQHSRFIYADVQLTPGLFYDVYERYMKYPEEVKSREDLMVAEYYQHYVRLYGNTDTSLHKFFRNGALSIVEGRHIKPDDQWKAIISEDLAKKNGLSIGDTISCELSEREVKEIYSSIKGFEAHEPYLPEIVGIFRINFMFEPSEFTPESDMPDSFVFIDNTMMLQYGYDHMERPFSYDSILFFVDDPQNIDQVIADVKKLDGIAWDYLEIQKDDTACKSVVKPLELIGGYSMLLIVAASLGCFVLLLLILSLWIRSRKREIGILMSIGIKKMKIIMQFIIECVLIGGVAFLISIFLSGAILPPISDSIQNIAAPNRTDQEYTVTLDEVAQPQIDPVAAADVDLKYSVSTSQYIGVGIAGVAVIVGSISLSCLFMAKLKPKDILSSQT